MRLVLPIRRCAFHCGHLTTTFLKPVSHFKKLSGCCTKLDEFTTRYSVFYHFTIRPFAINDWTGGGAKCAGMEVYKVTILLPLRQMLK